MKKHVLLVDDHQMVRRGFRLILETHGQLEVIGECSNADEALAAVRHVEPDLVIMDIHLPGQSGLEVSRQMLGELPELKIVVLSADADVDLVDEALRAGVSGYILKDSAPEELLRAVSAVLEGKLYLGAEVADLAIQSYKRVLTEPPQTRPELSPQEAMVLRLLAEGLRMKEIAAKMDISVKTAETYRRRLGKKAGAQSAAELTRYAVREGIVEP